MEELLTPEEAAEILKISKYTIYEMVKRGELPATRIGRKIRIDPRDLEMFVQSSKGQWDCRIEDEDDVDPVTSEPDRNHPVLFTGSHDLSLDHLVRFLNNRYPGGRMIPAFVGSMEGLLHLYHGQAEIAGCHLLDEETGLYNIPYVKRIFMGEKLYVIRFVQRVQGLMVEPGNPKGIRDWSDFSRKDITMVNRQKGAGTRVLLDYHLKQIGIDSSSIKGYEHTETTHYGAAAAVSRGEADVAVGIESAARAMGLEFIPLARENYDLVMRREFVQSEKWSQIRQTMLSDSFKEKITQLGGYEMKDMGEIVEEVC
ncbi:MAG: helix-turn-helix domain-containing protein [Bacillaceae bacterium]|nr:helix-turn-helix domain-containing protein [Bacillaceae bacterium]